MTESVPTAGTNLADYKLDRCNICGAPQSEFYAFFSETPNRCKTCQSLERHRILKWAYDMFIHREFPFPGKEFLVCTPGEAETRYILAGAKKIVTFDVRPVSWFDLQMDMCDMRQIADGSFDGFMAMAVLQHTRDDARAIDEIYRVLRPGGRLFVQASNIMNGRTKFFDNPVQHYTQEEYDTYGVGTYRVYGDTDLIRLLARRFVVKTFHGFDPITGGTDFIACGIKVPEIP
ncbi:MAG: class I SAM-dependent methyltransferase [Candidatus Sumerlaeia bacterium]